MGLSWQQGPLAPGAVGHFLTDQPVRPAAVCRAGSPPHANPLRQRLDRRQRTGDLAHEPAATRSPTYRSSTSNRVSSYPRTAPPPTATSARLGGSPSPARAGAPNGQPGPHRPARARLSARRARRVRMSTMDGFYEEDERTLGHVADNYHHVDIRSSSRHPRRPPRQERPSPKRPHPSSSTNRASHHAGTCPERMSTTLH